MVDGKVANPNKKTKIENWEKIWWNIPFDYQ